ncbi:hypothetical protein PsYK624_097050 [Phanerochaete sordida]|uniref:F-box domain-containing protein n=1 Tax=Phanerochaete sordida TaxID=48140 RepID=A0A9P3GEQ0_9APHY|nr:hypothetical protein PsYK624_097050 [Phanerochaete sordida]
MDIAAHQKQRRITEAGNRPPHTQPSTFTFNARIVRDVGLYDNAARRPTEPVHPRAEQPFSEPLYSHPRATTSADQSSLLTTKCKNAIPQSKADVPAGSEPPKPAAKRRARGSRTAGKLAPLLEMPVDIWFEIVSHLTPKDLLHLSRTSKHFRAMFMHRAQKHLWAAARRNVGLPDPPEHISEPRVAAVLFSSTCFGCGKRGLQYDLGLVVRYCKACMTEKVKQGDTLQAEYEIALDDLMPVFQLLPCSRRWWTYGNVDRNNELYDSYDAAQFESILIQHYALVENSDETALHTFIDERTRVALAAREFSKGLEGWENEQYAAKQKIERAREENIEEKLFSIGYTEADLIDLESWAPPGTVHSWKALVRQPHPLTPRIWKNIRPRLEALLAEAKAERERDEQRDRRSVREAELRDVYAEFLQDAPTADGPLPCATDAAQLPAVRALLDEDGARVPVTAGRLQAVLSALQEAARAHRAQLAQAVWAHLAERAHPRQRPSAWHGDPDDVYDGSAQWDAGWDDGWRTPPPRKFTPEELKNLPGVPPDIAPGSDDILGLATALFRCSYCVDRDGLPLDGAGDAVYSVAELAAHVHAEHAAHSPRARPRVDGEVARKVLKTLGLPADARYEDVSGRIVCRCATFRHPATLAQLVSHIMWETSLYGALEECRSFSACPDAVLADAHAFARGAPFLRLLGAGEVFAPPPLSDAEAALAARWARSSDGKPVACRICAGCATLPPDSPFWTRNPGMDDVPYVPRAPAMEPAVLVRHVRTTHGREARLDDAQEVRAVVEH